jgi:hypothetical protein
MHFQFIIISHWRVEIQTRRFKSGLGAARSDRAKHSNKGPEECEGGQGRGCDLTGSGSPGNVVRGCCWDESKFETESFIGIVQLAFRSGCC